MGRCFSGRVNGAKNLQRKRLGQKKASRASCPASPLLFSSSPEFAVLRRPMWFPETCFWPTTRQTCQRFRHSSAESRETEWLRAWLAKRLVGPDAAPPRHWPLPRTRERRFSDIAETRAPQRRSAACRPPDESLPRTGLLRTCGALLMHDFDFLKVSENRFHGAEVLSLEQFILLLQQIPSLHLLLSLSSDNLLTSFPQSLISCPPSPISSVHF